MLELEWFVTAKKCFFINLSFCNLVILSIQSSNDNYVYLYHPCVYSKFSLEIGKEKQIVIYQRNSEYQALESFEIENSMHLKQCISLLQRTKSEQDVRLCL